MNIPSQVDIALAAKAMKENLPAILEMQAIECTLLRDKYLKLVKAGFTEQQAIELCKKGS